VDARQTSSRRIGTPVGTPRTHPPEPSRGSRRSGPVLPSQYDALVSDRSRAAPMRVVTGATPLARSGAIHRAAVRAEWAAAMAAGLDLRIKVGDGLVFGAAPGLVSGMFNRALGLTEQPE